MDRKTKLRDLIRTRFGGNQADFAKAIKRAPAQVNQWLSGHRAIGDAGARIIETALSLPSGSFDDKNSAPCVAETRHAYLAKTEPSPSVGGHVPLISWVQACAWADIVDNFAPRDAEEWLACPVNHGPRTFVLRVRGESMWNPHGRPSFHEGDLLFVDLDRQAEPGSLVVVRLDDTKEATFKKLIVDGDKTYLRALNPAWPEPIIQVAGDATICGVAIFKGEPL